MKAKILVVSLISLCGVLLCPTIAARPTGYQSATIDLRIETLNIIAMLADYREYNTIADPAYKQEILDHFEPYKDHPVIELARRVRAQDHVSYGDLPFLAIHLSQPPAFEPLEPLSAVVSNSRWTDETAAEFVRLLPDFYRTAHVADFFARQQGYYRSCLEAVGPIYEGVDMPWFDEFFGVESKGAFHPIFSPGFGESNYGLRQGNDLYSTVGLGVFDENRRPALSTVLYRTILIHEFAHSFADPVNDLYIAQLLPAAEKIFEILGNMLRMQAVGIPESVIYEALVRATEVRYALAHGDLESARQTTVKNAALGFLWIGDLADLLGEYENNRDTYPDMPSFMPRIIEFYNELAADFPAYKAKMEARFPKVTAIEPFENGAQDVDPSIRQITFRFARPLAPGEGISFVDVLAESPFASPLVYEYSADRQSVIFHVSLKPDTEYMIYTVEYPIANPDQNPFAFNPVTFKTRNNNP